MRHLREFNRQDAVEAVLRTAPPFRVQAYEADSATDSSAGGPHGSDTSTNTLSSVSR